MLSQANFRAQETHSRRWIAQIAWACWKGELTSINQSIILSLQALKASLLFFDFSIELSLVPYLVCLQPHLNASLSSSGKYSCFHILAQGNWDDVIAYSQVMVHHQWLEADSITNMNAYWIQTRTVSQVKFELFSFSLYSSSPRLNFPAGSKSTSFHSQWCDHILSCPCDEASDCVWGRGMQAHGESASKSGVCNVVWSRAWPRTNWCLQICSQVPLLCRRSNKVYLRDMNLAWVCFIK